MFFLRNGQEGEQKEKNTCRPFLKLYARSTHPPTFRQNGAKAAERALSKKGFWPRPKQGRFLHVYLPLERKSALFCKIPTQGSRTSPTRQKRSWVVCLFGPSLGLIQSPSCLCLGKAEIEKTMDLGQFCSDRAETCAGE